MRYLSDTIDHHFLAVQMAQSCVQKAIHPELGALCQRIASDQGNEITQMQGWLTDWYLSEGVDRRNVDAEPELPPSGEQMLRQLQQASGAEFEIIFMQMMIQYHEMAVREAGHCLRQSYHAELRGLCGHIIGEQSAEIAQMRAWLCVWYDICEGRRKKPRSAS